MNNTIKTSLLLVVALFTMGVSLPSCPGQAELKQQVDALEAKNGQMAKQVQGLDAQVKTLNNEISEMKNTMTQMTTGLLAQKQSIDQLNENMKALASKGAKAAPAKGKPAKGKH